MKSTDWSRYALGNTAVEAYTAARDVCLGRCTHYVHELL